jgi:hypothetical protein
MTWKTRWHGALTGVALATALAAPHMANALDTPEPPARTKPIIGTITPDAKKWGEISFVYVPGFPYDGTPGSALKRPPLGPTSKTIFQSPEAGPDSELPVGQLIHLVYNPQFDNRTPPPGSVSHYHEFWEWGYTLKGDSIMPEPVSPFQKQGMYYRKKEGGWLTRPPYSLHGGTWEKGGMRNQLPYHLIIFEEGDGHVINVGKKPGEEGSYRGRDGKGPPPGTVGDWRKVERFTRPWLLDATRDVDWEEDQDVPGRFVKWLDDDMSEGFRAQLVKIGPNFKPTAEWKKTYNENANVLRYMVFGEMNVWTFKDAKDAGKAYQVKEDHFIYQPPRAIWGYGDGPITGNRGAIFLEVTYAKGLKHGGGPIEKPKSL